MKRLFAYADEYVRESDWKDMALLKFCLCAMGVMIGLSVSKKHKEPVFCAALGVFAATYVPLMAKFARILLRHEASETASETE